MTKRSRKQQFAAWAKQARHSYQVSRDEGSLSFNTRPNIRRRYVRIYVRMMKVRAPFPDYVEPWRSWAARHAEAP